MRHLYPGRVVEVGVAPAVFRIQSAWIDVRARRLALVDDAAGDSADRWIVVGEQVSIDQPGFGNNIVVEEDDDFAARRLNTQIPRPRCARSWNHQVAHAIRE